MRGDEPPRAACAEVDQAVFFPTYETKHAVARAAKFCTGGCPIANACLRKAIREDVRGIWAATSYKERKAFRKERGIQPESVTVTIIEREFEAA